MSWCVCYLFVLFTSGHTFSRSRSTFSRSMPGTSYCFFNCCLCHLPCDCNHTRTIQLYSTLKYAANIKPSSGTIVVLKTDSISNINSKSLAKNDLEHRIRTYDIRTSNPKTIRAQQRTLTSNIDTRSEHKKNTAVRVSYWGNLCESNVTIYVRAI